MNKGTTRTYYSIAASHYSDLHRGDPRDGGFAIVSERAVGVVLDENADAIDEAEGAEECAPAAEDNKPGLEAAVGKISGIGAAGRGHRRG